MNTPLLRAFLLAIVLPFAARAENGGPGFGGYIYSRISSPQTFQSIANTTGAISTAGVNPPSVQDDIDYDTPLGFTFRFYGVDYTHVHFSTNGLICLGNTGTTAFQNVNLTTTTVGTNLPAVAVYWDDLIYPVGTPGGLWIKKRTVDGLKEFVVEWDRTTVRDAAPETITVQAILREDGSMTFHYPDAQNVGAGNFGASATIGIRDVDGETGNRLQATANSAAAYLANGDRIDFRRQPDSRGTALDFTGRTTSPLILTALATADIVEDPDVTQGVAEGKSVWFRWVAPTDGVVSFSTAGSSFDTVMAVLDATNGTAITTSLVFDDDGGGDGTSRAESIEATTGQVFLIMVAGKDKGGGITSGTAQVSASFAPLERVSFFVLDYAAVEGREIQISLGRAHLNSNSLSVDVEITDPEGNKTMTTLSATGADDLPPLSFTPPDDAVFTVRRVYSFYIMPKPGVYVSSGPPVATVVVTDNEPLLVPARSFLGVLGTGALGGDTSPMSNGLVTLKTTATGGFSGKLTQAGATFPFKGQFDNAGFAETLIVRKGLAPIKVRLFLEEDGTLINLNVIRTDGRGGVQLKALTFSAKDKVPLAVQGRYTLLAPGDSLVGYNYGTGTVSATGAVKVAGVLADGTPFSFGTTLGPADSFRVSAYAKTHAGKGYFQVETRLDGTFGEARVFRPAGFVDKKTSAFAGGYYDSISSSDSMMIPYALPAPDKHVSDGFVTTNGEGRFDLGTPGAPSNMHVDFIFALTGRATSTTAGFTLRLDRKTGLYKGARPSPIVGGKPIPFGGALIPSINSGVGPGTGVGNSHDATTAHASFIVPRL